MFYLPSFFPKFPIDYQYIISLIAYEVHLNLQVKEEILKFCQYLKKIPEKFSRSEIFHIKSKVYIRYFVHGCLWKNCFDSNSPHASSKLNCIKNSATLRPLTPF